MLLGLGVGLALGLTKVYSKGVLVHELVLLEHGLVLLLEHELVGWGLVHELVSPVLEHELVLGPLLEYKLATEAKVPEGLVVLVLVLLIVVVFTKALALVSICLLANSRFDT